MIFQVCEHHNKNNFMKLILYKKHSKSVINKQSVGMVGINEDHMDLSRIPTASAENEVGTFLTFTVFPRIGSAENYSFLNLALCTVTFDQST